MTFWTWMERNSHPDASRRIVKSGGCGLGLTIQAERGGVSFLPSFSPPRTRRQPGCSQRSQHFLSDAGHRGWQRLSAPVPNLTATLGPLMGCTGSDNEAAQYQQGPDDLDLQVRLVPLHGESLLLDRLNLRFDSSNKLAGSPCLRSGQQVCDLSPPVVSHHIQRSG